MEYEVSYDEDIKKLNNIESEILSKIKKVK